MSNWSIYPRNGWETLRVLLSEGAWKHVSFQPQPGASISRDFFGINVAGSPNEAVNQFVLDQVQILGVKQLRMDFSYGDETGFQAVLLKELLANDFQVMLRLVQPVEEAAAMPGREASQRWGDFIDRLGAAIDVSRLAALEVGAVPNRKKWSGYTHPGYLQAWSVAFDRLTGVSLAGPNVSDFEPLHVILLLNEMRRMNKLPDIHSTNLFVERVREPEAFDHRVLGEKFTDRLKLNLIKKAGVFAALSARYGIGQTMCTHTCWNAVRMVRWTEDIERVRAAYLERYLVLAAASGQLDRVYWGPLIGHGDGLIDDGTGAIDPQERVAHYAMTLGTVSEFAPLPAFERFRELIALLSDAAFVSGDAAPAGPFEFVFKKDERDVTLRWERDGAEAGQGILYR